MARLSTASDEFFTKANESLSAMMQGNGKEFQPPYAEGTLNKKANSKPAADPIDPQRHRSAPRPDAPFLPSMIQKAFKLFVEVERSVKIVVKNNSSLELKHCQWYAHHGTYTENIDHNVRPEGTSVMIFEKTNYIFFGVSGFLEYTLEKGEKKRRMIVTFSAPLRGKPNAVSIITLDESDRKFMEARAITYSHLKQASITELQEKMENPVVFESSQGKGVCRNPSVTDDIVNVCIQCSISGNKHAKLDIIVSNT